METFASGFAKSFIATREARLAREADEENLQFKYKMDSLLQMKEKRTKKVAQETEWANQAKLLSRGDNDLAQSLYPYLSNGWSADKLQSQIDNGEFVRNENYVAPTKTVQMPTAVTNPNPTAPMEQYDDGMFTPTSRREQRRADKINKKIDSIDSTLRSGPAETDIMPQVDSANAPYQYVPKGEVKIGSYAQDQYELLLAQEKKDPVAIRKAEMKLKAHDYVMTKEAKAKAIAEGKTTQTYFKMSPDNKIIGQFEGRTEEGPDGSPVVININDPRDNKIETGAIVPMNKDSLDEYQSIRANFEKPNSEYTANAVNFINGMHSTQQMAQILEEDRHANTYVSQGLGKLKSLLGEAGAGLDAIEKLQVQIDSEIKRTDGTQNQEAIESLIAQQKEQIDQFVSKSGSLGPELDKSVVNAAKFQALKMNAANQLAQSMATDGRVSNADRQAALQIIGDSGDAEQIIPKLQTMMGSSYVKLKSQQTILGKNPSIEDFEMRHGVKTGLKPERVGNILQGMEIDSEQKSLLGQYLRNIHYGFDQARSIPQGPQLPTQGSPAPQAPAPAQTGEIDPAKMSVEDKTPSITLKRSDGKATMVSPGAIRMLKANPELKDAFEKKYGPGTAKEALAQ